MATSLTPCTTAHKKPKFTLAEKGSRVEFANPNTHPVDEITVDDCVIKAGLRCDYLVNVETTATSVLVELKGSDVAHALEQLEASHTQLEAQLHAKRVWIVSAQRCPLASSEIQNHQLRLRKKRAIHLIVKNSPVSYTL